MSTTTNPTDTPLFSVRNHHLAECGIPPRIDDRGAGRYLGYFENQYGEQAVFVYDRDSNKAVLAGSRHASWSMVLRPILCSPRPSGYGSAHVASRYCVP
jgi:hypothetical protein